MRLALAIVLVLLPAGARAFDLFSTTEGEPMNRRQLVLTGAASLSGGCFLGGLGLYLLSNPMPGDNPLEGARSPAVGGTLLVLGVPLVVLSVVYFVEAAGSPTPSEPNFFTRAWRHDPLAARGEP